MSQQNGNFVLTRCKICGGLFPVLKRCRSHAKFCEKCKRKAEQERRIFTLEPTAEMARDSRARARRRAEFLKARDAAWASVVVPEKVEVVGGLRVVSRGYIPGRATHSPAGWLKL